MAEQYTDLLSFIDQAVPGKLLGHNIAFGELTLEVRAEDIVDILKFLRDDPACAFTQLMDVCGVDYPDRAERFEVVYHLLSMTQNMRIRVKLAADEQTQVPSVTELFDAAGWFEREAFDLYGIYFAGHPDLRRLLTDYGFEGHPLRKDFPLTGHVEVRWDDDEKRVVQEPVKLAPDFRDLDFVSPWDGARGTDVLPGDEKAPAENE